MSGYYNMLSRSASGDGASIKQWSGVNEFPKRPLCCWLFFNLTFILLGGSV